MSVDNAQNIMTSGGKRPNISTPNKCTTVPKGSVLGLILFLFLIKELKIVSEYDQEIPQSQTADNPVAP